MKCEESRTDFSVNEVRRTVGRGILKGSDVPMSNEDGNLYTCDLICYGVASPGVFQDFCLMLEKMSGRALLSYVHRGSGIPEGGDERACYTDGSTESGSLRVRLWKRLWFKYLCRESCFRCAYHSTARQGDITLGDYWGLEKSTGHTEDGWGTSSVLVNRQRGMRLLRAASPRLNLLRSSLDAIANEKQPMLAHPPARDAKEEFWDSLYATGFRCACRKVGVLGPMRAAKDLVKKTKAIASKVRVKKNADSVIREWESSHVIDFELLERVGEYPIAFAARNRNCEIRRMSSSGGMFHALAMHVIEELNGVVYGCAFNDELRAGHVRCETMAEVERCMGSKYSQSDMGDSIRLVWEDLKVGRTVLFAGTPCQVAAVRAVCRERKKRGGVRS